MRWQLELVSAGSLFSHAKVRPPALLDKNLNKRRANCIVLFLLLPASIDKIYLFHEILTEVLLGIVAMSVDSQSFEARLRVRNETWRNYRVQGTCAFPSSATHERLYRRHCIQNPRPLPNRNSLHFFDNWKWTPRLYETTANTVGEIHRLSDFDPIFNQRSANAQARYRELTAYFGDPRYAVQKVLGMGGNGMAVHFKDRGSSSTDDPGRDIVVKVALDDWQSDAIVEEKNSKKFSKYYYYFFLTSFSLRTKAHSLARKLP